MSRISAKEFFLWKQKQISKGGDNQNLSLLIDSIGGLSNSDINLIKIRSEKNELANQKAEIEKKNEELMREHRYLKDKIQKLQLEVSKKTEIENKFNQDIEELRQETENLVNEIEKWQM